MPPGGQAMSPEFALGVVIGTVGTIVVEHWLFPILLRLDLRMIRRGR